MVITYYVDVIFIVNLIMDFALLLLIHPKQKISYTRLFGAAGTGAVGAVLLLINEIPVWGYMALRLLLAVLITGIGIPYKGVGELFCNTALLYGTGATLYGISFMISGKVQSKVTYLLPLIATVMLFLGRCLYCFREKRKSRNQYRFEVILKNFEKSIKVTAFYDSGNHLYEPISGCPVILVKENILKVLGIKEDSLRVVPYQAVGNTAGILHAYPMEALTILVDGEKKIFTNLYAAVVPGELLNQEECDVILHGNFV